MTPGADHMTGAPQSCGKLGGWQRDGKDKRRTAPRLAVFLWDNVGYLSFFPAYLANVQVFTAVPSGLARRMDCTSIRPGEMLGSRRRPVSFPTGWKVTV